MGAARRWDIPCGRCPAPTDRSQGARPQVDWPRQMLGDDRPGQWARRCSHPRLLGEHSRAMPFRYFGARTCLSSQGPGCQLRASHAADRSAARSRMPVLGITRATDRRHGACAPWLHVCASQDLIAIAMTGTVIAISAVKFPIGNPYTHEPMGCETDAMSRPRVKSRGIPRLSRSCIVCPDVPHALMAAPHE